MEGEGDTTQSKENKGVKLKVDQASGIMISEPLP